jgi:hypothetical protein
MLPNKRSIIQNIFFSNIFTLLLIMCGCCHPYDNNQPKRPSSVQGWKSSVDGTILTLGSFVLKKGEYTENNKIGVKFIDLKPRIICSGLFSEPRPGEINLRFYRPDDQRVLCDATIFTLGTSGSDNLNCPWSEDLPTTVYVRAINTEDGWVWLDLRTSVGARQ